MQMLSRIPSNYVAIAILLLWGAALVLLDLLRQSVIGLDEASARNLLLLWSIADRVASPVGTFGSPDLRSLLFIPPAIYWPGSVLAAKIFTVALTFYAVYLLFKWNSSENNESSLIGAALFLISPLTISQIDTLGAGPFLVLCVALAYWVDQRYREKGRHLGGWFFMQLIIVALAVSIHPIGLAYPLALALIWFRRNDELAKERKRSIFIGAAIATLLIAIFRMGWQDDLAWLTNPIQTLANAIQNGSLELGGPANIAVGVIAALLISAVMFFDRKQLLADIPACFLFFAIIIGLFVADGAWALMCITYALFRGFRLLIDYNESFKSESMVGKRGLVIAVAFLCATSFMLVDKRYSQAVAEEVFSPQDELIRTLCQDANELKEDAPFKAASEWPARTMIACRRDVFPLPPAAENGEALVKNIEGITHLIFNHTSEDNKALASNIAEISSVAKTLDVQPGGVIIEIAKQDQNNKDQTSATAPPHNAVVTPQENK